MRLRFTIGLLILKIAGKFPVDAISLSLNFDQHGPFGDSHLEYDKIGIFVAWSTEYQFWKDGRNLMSRD